MIVIDTSALAAIFRREPDAARHFERIARADARLVPPSCVVEFTLLRRYGGDRRAWLAKFVSAQEVQVVSFTPEMADVAAKAADDYGRGSGHRAGLNFGDCLSYAVAKHLKAPLLYKGDDFTHTDIESALPA